MRRRIIALALAATLAVGGGAAYAWEFFVLYPYGAPASPVYAEF